MVTKALGLQPSRNGAGSGTRHGDRRKRGAQPRTAPLGLKVAIWWVGTREAWKRSPEKQSGQDPKVNPKYQDTAIGPKGGGPS